MNTHRILIRVSAAFVLLTALLPQAWHASAQTTVSPQLIDQYLGSKHIANIQGQVVPSPLNGLGSTFVDNGSQYGVDPRLIVAISGAESSFGVHICAANNAWNWFWNVTCANSPFDSWNSGITTLSHFMAKSYILHGYNTVSLIGARYCAAGCENWVPNVTEFLADMGGDPSSLTWNASGTGSGTTSGGVPVTSSSNGTTSGDSGSDDLPSTQEQVLAPVVTVQPAGFSLFGVSETKVNVTAEVSGQSLKPGSVQVWQELPSQGEAMIAQLSAAGPGALGGTNYGGTITIQGAPPVELWVSASFQDGSFVHLSSSSTALIQGPAASGSGSPLVIVFAIFVLLAAAVAVTVLIRRSRKKQPA